MEIETKTEISTETITPIQYIRMLKSGAHRVLEKEKVINDINVFPISDHDTGTNIATLMRFLVSQHYSTESFSILFKEIANKSLMSSVGNSGIILSAYFNGFTKASALDLKAINPTIFLNCLDHGVTEAYQSVNEPVEGTILTLMAVFKSSFDGGIKQSQNFIDILKYCLNKMDVALKETERQLLPLKKAHVVDAGAYAFSLFTKGMLDSLTKTEIQKDIDIIYPDMVIDHETHSHFNYCFENTLTHLTISKNELINHLKPLGDSIAVNNTEQIVKVHIHTNDCFEISEFLATIANIQCQKIDDMALQQKILHQKNRIALVTDSSADIPDEIIQSFPIHLIDVPIRWGNHSLINRYTINLEKLYNGLFKKNLNVTTSTPPPEVVSRLFHLLSSHYQSIIVISIAGKLSGMYQLLLNQAKKMSNINIQVIDSKTNSVAHGLLVLKAAELIHHGHDVKFIVERIEQLIKTTKIYAAISNFQSVIRSGRAPKTIALIANLTGFKPIISVDHQGKPSLAAIAFGKNQSEKKFKKLLKNFLKDKKDFTLAIVNSLANEKAEKMKMFLKEEFNIEPFFVKTTSPAIGLHAGQGCVAIGILQDKITPFE